MIRADITLNMASTFSMQILKSVHFFSFSAFFCQISKGNTCLLSTRRDLSPLFFVALWQVRQQPTSWKWSSRTVRQALKYPCQIDNGIPGYRSKVSTQQFECPRSQFWQQRQCNSDTRKLVSTTFFGLECQHESKPCVPSSACCPASRKVLNSS